MTELPASVQEIADVLGVERALFLAGQLPSFKGGTPGKAARRVIMYVPRQLTPNHRLVDILGPADAQRLVDAFGGEILHPANCASIGRVHRDAAIRADLGAGMRVPVAAFLYDLTERAVRGIARRGNPA